MQKLTLLATTASIILTASAQDDQKDPSIKPTCVSKDDDVQGYPSSGQPFSDWDYLAAHESPDYQYRLTGVQLCTDDEGHLRGMEAYVGKYSTAKVNLISTLAMNKIGDVSGACKSLHVDPLKGEYIKRIIMRAGSSYVDAVWIGASTRQVIYNGNHPAEFTDQVFDFSWEKPLIGFWGSAVSGEWIYSLGTVSVETDCTMEGSESMQMIEDINGGSSSSNSQTDFFSQWQDKTGLDVETTIFVAAATTTILVLALVLCLVISAYMRKRVKRVQGQGFAIKNQSSRNEKSQQQDTTDAVDQDFEQNKRLSVKKVNGQTEVHMELPQNVGTDIETSQQDQESARNLSQAKIEDSENVISDVNLGEKFRSPNRNKTFKVVQK